MRGRKIASRLIVSTLLLTMCLPSLVQAAPSKAERERIKESSQRIKEEFQAQYNPLNITIENSSGNVTTAQNIQGASQTTATNTPINDSGIIVVDCRQVQQHNSSSPQYNQGVSSADEAKKIQENTMTLNDLKTRLAQTSYCAGWSDEQLTGMAWCISVELKTLKSLDYQLGAVYGIFGNLTFESGFNPYVLERHNPAAMYKIFKVDENITLAVDGQSVYVDESSQGGSEKLMDTGRINMDVSGGAAPIYGIGLLQFTDCSLSETTSPTWSTLKNGLRRSNAIYCWKNMTADPWAAVLKTAPYNYWQPSTDTDLVRTVEYNDEDGNQHTMEIKENAKDAPLVKSDSQTKLLMAAPDMQILFVDSDDYHSWGINSQGKSDLTSLGLDSVMSWDAYKAYNGGLPAATAYWCAGMERPSKDKNGNSRTIIRYNDCSKNSLATTTCEIAADYYGGTLNLDSVATYGTNPASAVANGTGGASAYSATCKQAHNTALAKSGYLNESQCSDIMVQAEGQVSKELLQLAQRSYLNQQELNALIDWENEVRVNSFENTMVLMGRRIVLFIGIIVMIWSILLYLAYWFDKLNTVVFVDLLGKLSFGHLCIADVDDHATYFNKREAGHKVKTLTVSHRDIFFITCTGFAISTVMVTGMLFKWIYFIVMKIYNFLQ